MAEQKTAAEVVAAKVKAARVAKVPLVLIQTADPAETTAAILAGSNSSPVLAWDVVRGIYGRNDPGDRVATSKGWNVNNTRQPLQLLTAIGSLDTDDRPVFVMANAHRFLVDVTVVQAVWNLRDVFKASGAMLVMVSPAGQKGALPDELTRDVLVIEHALPDDERVRDIVRGMLANTKGAKFEVSDDLIADAAAALRGAAAFACEQLTALTVVEGGKERFDLDGLMAAAKRLISETQGLAFEQGKETFDDVGGLNHVREFARRLFAGPHRPAAVVRVEELEKSMAGSQGDLSGVSQDALRVWLQAMEENGWTGILAVGCPGCLDGDTPIYDPVDGTTDSVASRWGKRRPFRVIARDVNDQCVIADAAPPMKYAPAEMVRFRLSNGDHFTVTLGHRLWDGVGYVSAREVVERLEQFGVVHLPTIWGIDPRVPQQDGRRSTRTGQGFLVDCRADSCFCDGPLPPEGVGARSLLPLRADAPALVHQSSRVDALGDTHRHSLHSRFARHANMDCLCHVVPADEAVRQQIQARRVPGASWNASPGPCLRSSSLIGIATQPFGDVPASMPTCQIESTATNAEAVLQRTWGMLRTLPQCRELSAPTNRGQSTLRRRLAEICLRNVAGELRPQQTVSQVKHDGCLSPSGLRLVQETDRNRTAAPPRVFGHPSISACGASVVDPYAWRSEGNATLRIVGFERAGVKPYYDFHVPGYENYFACGCFHHNSGKSLIARSMANTFGAKPILFDVGACKGSLVGQSESRIRAAMQVLWTIAGPRAFFVASVNNLANVPPELQRRFTGGVWYFDTPSDEDRAEIWRKKLAEYGLESQRHLVTDFVDEADLTGADIRNICKTAVALNCTVHDALQFVVPLKRQSPTIIAEARALAAGRFIDAARGGAYVPPNMRKRAADKREIN